MPSTSILLSGLSSKTQIQMALRSNVTDLIWLYFFNNTGQVASVTQVSIVQLEAGVVYVGVLVDVVDTVGVKRAGTAFDAVHFVALVQQQLRQVGAVLAGYAGN